MPRKAPDPAVKAKHQEEVAELRQHLWRTRCKLGLSREMAAEEVGVTDPTIWRWETAQTIPTPVQFARWRKSLGI